MPSTKDIQLGKKLMILLIGRNGNGKTCQVASFAKAGPGKYFDFDGRMDSVRAAFPNLDIEYDIYGVNKNDNGVKGFDEFTTEFFDLRKNCPYKWICLDSATSMTTTIVNYQMMLNGGTKTTKGNIVVPSWDEFNGEAMVVSRILDVAKILPCHVIFTCHPVEKMDINNNKRVESIVSFGVKVPNLIPGYFNEIFYLDIEKSVNADKPPDRVIYTGSSERVFTKTTLPLPRRFTVNNDQPGLYDVIQAALSKK